MMRLVLYLNLLLLASGCVTAEVPRKTSCVEKSCWHTVLPGSDFTVNGLRWYDENKGSFCRLPLSYADRVKAVNKSAWRESFCTSTVRVRFKTDSPDLALRITPGLKQLKRLAMWHMSSVAVSGIDLYVGPPGKEDYWQSSCPKYDDKTYEHVFFKNRERKMREFTLYLPSYSAIRKLEIGLRCGSKILPPTPYRHTKAIVIYGSSITQGGCTGRCSNSFIAITGRRLNSEVINLGFSGSGRGDEVLAELLGQIDASIYVIDCVANMNVKLMNQRYEKFVRILRNRRPQTPIVLMTKIHYAREILPEEAAIYSRQNKPVFDTYNKLKALGDKNIYLFDAGAIIKAGGDHPSVDGIHLTDWGTYRMAEKLTPFLGKILSGSSPAK